MQWQHLFQSKTAKFIGTPHTHPGKASGTWIEKWDSRRSFCIGLFCSRLSLQSRGLEFWVFSLGEEGECGKGRNLRALGLRYRELKWKREVVCAESTQTLAHPGNCSIPGVRTPLFCCPSLSDFHTRTLPNPFMHQSPWSPFSSPLFYVPCVRNCPTLQRPISTLSSVRFVCSPFVLREHCLNLC